MSGHTGYRHLQRLFVRRFVVLLNEDQHFNLQERVKQFVATCMRCQQYTPDNRAEPPVTIAEEPIAPGECWSFDYITDLPLSELMGRKYDAILTGVDRFTRRRFYAPARKKDTFGVANVMDPVASVRAMPETSV